MEFLRLRRALGRRHSTRALASGLSCTGGGISSGRCENLQLGQEGDDLLIMTSMWHCPQTAATISPAPASRVAHDGALQWAEAPPGGPFAGRVLAHEPPPLGQLRGEESQVRLSSRSRLTGGGSSAALWRGSLEVLLCVLVL